MKAELEKLVALQHADSKIKRLQTAINTVSERRGRLEQEFEARAFEIRQIEKTREEATAERSRLEKELAEANSKLERAERNLKAAQNQKQYEAAMREKGTLQKQIDEFNTQLVDKMSALEAVDAQLAERAEEIANLESERAAQLEGLETEVEAQKKEISSETARREKAIATLPKNLSATYNRLVTRIRDGVAVAEVKNGACASCFMSLRPQMLVDIRLGGKIITCENCHRILFLAPAEEAAKPTVANA